METDVLLADALVKLAPPEFSFKQMQISGLPLYNQYDDANQAESVKRLKAEVSAAHALLFVTAEYNRLIPGVLKNAIDHASRLYGQNAWAGKPAGLLGASVGVIGTAMQTSLTRNSISNMRRLLCRNLSVVFPARSNRCCRWSRPHIKISIRIPNYLCKRRVPLAS